METKTPKNTPLRFYRGARSFPARFHSYEGRPVFVSISFPVRFPSFPVSHPRAWKRKRSSDSSLVEMKSRTPESRATNARQMPRCCASTLCQRQRSASNTRHEARRGLVNVVRLHRIFISKPKPTEKHKHMTSKPISRDLAAKRGIEPQDLTSQGVVGTLELSVLLLGAAKPRNCSNDKE